MKHLLPLLFLLLSFASRGQQYAADLNTNDYFPLLKHKDIAVVANAASLVKGVNIVDTLVRSGISVKTIFSPEHGFRTFAAAGETVNSSVDSVTGIQIISLYGKKKKPDPSDLKRIDMVVFDLQDVGVRFFTYISTLTYVMEACAENNVPLMVLDRANPNVFYIDGPVLDSSQISFVGMHPVPIVYGMTIGEYAQMVNGEGWLKNGEICDLQVMKMKDYTHQTLFTRLEAAPSPNLKNLNAVYLYPTLCLFEGTKISVGRGTDFPFETFGHPSFHGFMFSFRPLPTKTLPNPLYGGQLCQGEDLRQFYNIHPRLFGRLNLLWLYTAYRAYGSQPDFFNDYFDKLAGTPQLRQQILQNLSESEIRKTWDDGLNVFAGIRKKYLLYPE